MSKDKFRVTSASFSVKGVRIDIENDTAQIYVYEDGLLTPSDLRQLYRFISSVMEPEYDY